MPRRREIDMQPQYPGHYTPAVTFHETDSHSLPYTPASLELYPRLHTRNSVSTQTVMSFAPRITLDAQITPEFISSTSTSDPTVAFASTDTEDIAPSSHSHSGLEPASQKSPRSYSNLSYPGYTPATLRTVKAIRRASPEPKSSATIPPIPQDSWKSQTIPFLALPPEIHLAIFKLLDPIDTVCLSLVK